MDELREQGWYLSDEAYKLISDAKDPKKMMKKALDYDLREIGSGKGDLTQGNVIWQLQKVRNAAAPKNNEESRAAPRMLKLSLTDGSNHFQAIEMEPISSLSINTPPGTKILMKKGTLPLSHGIILLRPSHIAAILGGRVPSLVEKWEMNKKLAQHSRVRPPEEGGPPPWIPFGKKIVKISDNETNFKALAEKEKASKENAEFEAQRKDAIAEAARQGSRKVFGGGNKQLLDHSVQRIVDHGFSIEQAEHALRINRNNVDRALKSLQRNDARSNRDSGDSANIREPREPKGKRFEKKTEEAGKPSSGRVSLFDFLEDKLSAQSDVPAKAKVSPRNDLYNGKNNNNAGRYEPKSNVQGRSSWSVPSGGRGQQQTVSEDVKTNKPRGPKGNHGTLQYPSQNSGNSSVQWKPPRFQKNVENNINTSHQTESNSRGGSKKNSYYDNKNGYAAPRGESGNDVNYNQNRNRQDQNQGHNYSNSSTEQSYTNRRDRHQANSNSEYDDNKAWIGYSEQKGHSNNHHSTSTAQPTGAWVWHAGDKCMAKYWEDNRYYNAEVTAVSQRTCVVLFKDFNNYEEVLQVDCIPITTEDSPILQESNASSRRSDQRTDNKQPRHNQGNHITTGMEFRRGGGGSATGSRGYNRRAQHRSTQPIYQPPGQRNYSPSRIKREMNSES